MPDGARRSSARIRAEATASQFDAVYRDHAAFVAALVACYRVPPGAIADATQEVFITAYRRWDDFEDDRPLRPWLAGIARRVAFRHRRTAARVHRKRAALRAVPGADSNTEAQRIEDADFLERFLAALPAEERKVLILAELEGYTSAEIAERLGCTPEASYACLRRARRRLKKVASREAAANAREYQGVVPPFAVLCARLPESGATPWWSAALGSTGTKVVAAVAAAAAIVTVGIVVDRGAKPEVVQLAKSGHRSQAKRDDGSAPKHRSTPEAMPAIQSTTTAVASAMGSAASGASARVGKPQARERSAGTSATGDSNAGSLEQEVELLGGARRALDQGQPSRALDLLKQHRTRFPDGELAAGRTRAMIRAHCDLGQVRQAQGQAALFARTHPNDPLALQAEHICAAEGRTAGPPGIEG